MSNDFDGTTNVKIGQEQFPYSDKYDFYLHKICLEDNFLNDIYFVSI